ncbi:IS200/IS605 family transposase [Rubinisphaera sp.]|uniref:IS200/IS605 family transposase n=1 Tax=Rubinisphaera sp. TaxID=2024857 RepID=UPI000C0DE2C2|nr:IS200/IS605 family transposase [Rubinisphaera sp.]MBV08238.1 IS200/IS605 family transposase [Rubinisphaera sp.]HCS52572.1 IS200/IS605 family transposase [Planctomycetaceae bacterium]|tara:strand:- start:3730 stop:4149 length:420 start_codon:yes stop_codon:yes gene_type:complete
MSRFRKLSHAILHCQYHFVWVPKYRYRILTELVGQEVESCIRAFVQRFGTEVIELNIQPDHVHLLAIVPPKVSISEFVGTIKGSTAIRVFNKFRHLKHKPYWGNHFWARGYCVDTVRLDAEKIRLYVKYQEEQEKRIER